MADEKPGDKAKPSDRLKRASPLQFRTTKSAAEQGPVPPEAGEADLRAAAAREAPRGPSWRGILGTGLMGATAFACGVGVGAGGAPVVHVQMMTSAADSVVNAIAEGLASASKLASPEVRTKAELVFRSALSATFSECESLAKDLGEEALKAAVEMGASAVVLKYALTPLLQRLKAAPANPVVAGAAGALQKIADKLGDEPKAKLDERTVASWAEVTPEEARLLLRALKLHEVDGRWLIETNRPSLDLALSVER